MVLSFIPESEKVFNGVISFLNKTVASKYLYLFSTPSASSSPVENILTTDENYYLASETEGDDLYVGLTLKQHSLLLQYFTIVQYRGGGANLLYWKLQGTNSQDLCNNDNWKDIYVVNGERNYCPVGPVPTFSIPIEKFAEYSSFRIFKTGESCNGNDYMRLAHIELFGILKGPLANTITSCKEYVTIIKYVFIIFIQYS